MDVSKINEVKVVNKSALSGLLSKFGNLGSLNVLESARNIVASSAKIVKKDDEFKRVREGSFEPFSDDHVETNS